MYKLLYSNIFFFISLLLLQLSCQKPIGQQKQYLHKLKILAKQHGKHFVSVYNMINDSSQRSMILQENTRKKENTLETNIDSVSQKQLFIQTFFEYANRYLIADTTTYNLSIIDIPFQTDSIIDVTHLHGKYLGYMIDTTLGATHQYLVMDLPIPCTFNINKQESVSYSDVIVLYDMQNYNVFPIEILDYKCSQVNEYEKNAYQDICFCQKTHQEFLNFLQEYIQKLREKHRIYPMKFKKITH